MWIFVIRHGETDGNRNRVVQAPDTPLSINGHRQAKQLAASFADKSAATILCSSHVRTQQTAAPLRDQLQCPMVLSDLLQERSFGLLRGKAYDDIQGDIFADDFQPPGGESHPQFIHRVKLAWQEILKHARAVDGNLVVMTHGLVLRSLLTDILAISDPLLVSVGFENTCVTQIKKDDLSVIPMLCDVAHLEETTLVSSGKV